MRQETLMQILENPSVYSLQMLMKARDKLFHPDENSEEGRQVQADRDKLTKEITARP